MASLITPMPPLITLMTPLVTLMTPLITLMTPLMTRMTPSFPSWQIALEHKERELDYAHAALARAKQGPLSRLDARWERMLMLLAWQVHCLITP